MYPITDIVINHRCGIYISGGLVYVWCCLTTDYPEFDHSCKALEPKYALCMYVHRGKLLKPAVSEITWL
jgi:hypothetical protein